MQQFNKISDGRSDEENHESLLKTEGEPVVSRSLPPEPLQTGTGGGTEAIGHSTQGEQTSGESKTTANDVALVNVIGLTQTINSIASSAAKTASEVREMHKLYHNEFANRLKSMQDELERYREIDKGRAFDGILGEVAKLYSDNESVLEDIVDQKVKKRIYYLLMDIVQILEANGVVRHKSTPKEKRNPRYCQVVERITTTDPSLHDTIALSRSTGFYRDNRALLKELVDIYLYSAPNEEHSEIT